MEKWEEKLNNDIEKMSKNKNKRRIGLTILFVVLVIVTVIFILFILVTIGSPLLISILMEIDEMLGH